MVYYVEDDDNIRELLIYTLRQVGMEACGFADGAAFRAAMERQLPDLILLDVMLPGEDGYSILRRLRSEAATRELPIIMVTAKDAEYDKVQGLDLGADDYITKPFGMAELLARIRAKMRRAAPKHAADTLKCSGVTVDLRAHRVHVDGAEISLTLKEYALLKLLMENRGMAFTREKLLERVWDTTFDGGSRTVDVHIQTLRAKMGPYGHLIETVRGVGYRMTE